MASQGQYIDTIAQSLHAFFVWVVIGSFFSSLFMCFVLVSSYFMVKYRFVGNLLHDMFACFSASVSAHSTIHSVFPYFCDDLSNNFLLKHPLHRFSNMSLLIMFVLLLIITIWAHSVISGHRNQKFYQCGFLSLPAFGFSCITTPVKIRAKKKQYKSTSVKWGDNTVY